MKSLKEDFTLMSSLLIPVAVAVNFTGFGIAKALSVPLFLDSIGSVFISLIAGPWVGVVTALITSTITGSFSPEYFAFIPVAVTMALCMGYLARFKMKNLIIKTFVCAFCLVFIAIVVSAPIIVYVYGGNTGNATAGVTAFFLAAGQNIWSAVFSTNFITETTDKIITAVVAMLIIKSMSERYLIKFKYGDRYIKSKDNAVK